MVDDLRDEGPQHGPVAGAREAPARTRLDVGIAVTPWPLVALAAVVMALAALGVLPRWPGLIHLVALPPLDLFTDLRMLLTHAPSYPVFIAGLAVSLAVRISILALMLGGFSRARLRLATLFYIVALVPAFLASAFTYLAPATLFYLPFWLGFLLAVAAFAVLAASPWMRETRLRAAFRVSWAQRFRAGTVFAYLGLLLVIGFIADLTGPAGVVFLVPVSAGLTLAAVHLLVANTGLRIARRAMAAAAAAVLATLAAVLLTTPLGPPAGDLAAEPRDGSLFILSGIDSRSGRGVIFQTNPHVLGFTCEQTFYYSYAGPGEGTPQRDAFCPIRTGALYEPADTLRHSSELEAFFHQQVEVLPAPVVVTAHSQGVWVTWGALAQGMTSGVSSIVLVGPLISGTAGYPPAGEAGPGRVGGDVLRLLLSGARAAAGTAIEPDGPMPRQFLAEPNSLQRLFSRPLPDGMRVLSVTSVSDLPLAPGGWDGWQIEGAANICPMTVIHPHIPWMQEYHQIVDAFLDGEPPPPCPIWRPAIGPLTRPFSAPPVGR